MFLAIWIIVGLLILTYGLFQAGRTGKIDFFVLVPLALVWPIALGASIVVSPLVGVYYLGRLMRKE